MYLYLKKKKYFVYIVYYVLKKFPASFWCPRSWTFQWFYCTSYTINIDRPTKHSLPFTKYRPTVPLSRKWGDFVD